jgi:hypothetical protein
VCRIEETGSDEVVDKIIVVESGKVEVVEVVGTNGRGLRFRESVSWLEYDSERVDVVIG